MIKGRHFLVLGRIGLDINPEPVDASLEDCEFLRPVLGGSAGNTAAGLARLGNKVAMISCLSDDAIGRRVVREMDRYGISHEYVRVIGGDARTSIHFAENLAVKPQVVLYRNGAADFELSPTDVAKIDYSQWNALIVSGTALAREPSRSAVFEALGLARNAGLTTILDLDYRQPSWRSKAEAAEAYRDACEYSDIIIGNDEEFDVMGGGEPMAREMGQSKLVVYKLGRDGAIAFDHGKESRHGIYPVNALKPIGSGDAFMAGFTTILAKQGSLEDAMNQGAATAAIVVSRPACAPAMPTQAELDTFMRENKIHVYSAI